MVCAPVELNHHGGVSYHDLVELAANTSRYDTALLGSFFAFPHFNEDYGTQLPSGKYEVPAGWQAGLMNGALAGSMIGLAANG